MRSMSRDGYVGWGLSECGNGHAGEGEAESMSRDLP